MNIKKFKASLKGRSWKRWTGKQLKLIAQKFKTRKQWQTGDCTTYALSLKRGRRFHTKACAHMKLDRYIKNPPLKPLGYWTKERVIAEGAKFKNSKEWRSKSISSYIIAYRNGWFHQVPTMVKYKDRKYGRAYWTEERICTHLKRSSQIVTQVDWALIHPSSFKAALKLDIVNKALSK